MSSELAGKVENFVERFLTLGGSFAGQPFQLMDFQRDILEDIYRTDSDGHRLRRRYLLGLPRKNGKSQLGAALALFHLVADDADARPLVISAAGDRNQARLVFEEAVRMVRASPELSRRLQVLRNEIRNPHNGGVYKAVSSDAGLQHGLNPSVVIFDELHVFKNADLLEALTSGSAMRREPLFIIISTAGFDLGSPLGKLYQYGLRVDGHRVNGIEQRGELEDATFGMTWFGPKVGTEFDRQTATDWRAFNPASAIMPDFENFMASQLAAMGESSFTRFHLNGWTSSEASFLPAGAWEACDRVNHPTVDSGRVIEADEMVILALDAAWHSDSTGLVLVSMEDLHTEVLGHWEPPPNQPDWRTPIIEVEDKITEAADRFNMREFAADPYRFERNLEHLGAAGLPVVEFPSNSLGRMVPATLGFIEAVNTLDLSHDGHAGLARHLASTQTKEDHRGIRITKDASRRHIDLAVAAVIAQHRARAWRKDPNKADARIILI